MDQRSELSKKNKYYIPKHRYLELKHFCLQYPEWEKEYNKIFIKALGTITYSDDKTRSSFSDKTSELAMRRAAISKKMETVFQSAVETDSELYPWLLKAAIKGMSYETLDPPCSRGVWYEKYREFFYILSKNRD